MNRFIEDKENIIKYEVGSVYMAFIVCLKLYDIMLENVILITNSLWGYVLKHENGYRHSDHLVFTGTFEVQLNFLQLHFVDIVEKGKDFSKVI